MDKNKIIHGDALTVLRTLPDGCVNLVVTSPPYYGLRNYKTEPQIWGGSPQCEHKWIEDATNRSNASGGLGYKQDTVRGSHHTDYNNRVTYSNNCSKCQAWKGSLGLEQHPQFFVDHLIEIFREVKRTLRENGSAYIIIADSYYGSGGTGGDYNAGGLREGQPKYKQGKERGMKDGWLRPKQKLMIPARVAIALQEDSDPWLLRNVLIWSKPNAMPSSVKDRYSTKYEDVLFLVKNPRYYFDLDSIRIPHVIASLERVKNPILGRRKFTEGCAWGDNDIYSLNPLGANPTDILRDWGASPDGCYNGQATKDYDSAQIQNPSDVKRRIIQGFLDHPKRGKHPSDIISSEDNINHIKERIGDAHSGEATAGLYRPHKTHHKLGKNPSDVVREESHQPSLFGGHEVPVESAGTHRLGANPRDIIAYDSKYETGNSASRNRIMVAERTQSRLDVEKLFPANPATQQAYVNYVHDHGGNKNGKNLGDIVSKYGSEPEDFNSPRARHIRPNYDAEKHDYHPLGANSSDVSMYETDFHTVNTHGFPEAHFAVYPTKLITPFILASCPLDGVVLDPFMGSGTTCAVTKALGRNYLGIELNPDYVKLAEKRVGRVAVPFTPILKLAEALKAIERI